MASLDLGTLSYTMKINGDGFSSGISKAKESMGGLDNAIKENNSAIDQNKTKMSELESKLKEASSSLAQVKAKFGENSEEYKKAQKRNTRVIQGIYIFR